MQERLFHFIWQNKLFNTKELKTIDGSDLQIIDFGKHNKDGGPDFWNAKIKIDDVILIGNIELHINATDWKKHKHQQDKKYDNVILHVVYFNDEATLQIPTLELNGRISRIIVDKYEILSSVKQTLICENLLANVDTFTIENWKERVAIERLERKADEILHNLSRNNNDWEVTFYQLIGKYFGSHINKEPFEQLTNLVDYKILLKHADSILQVEALLFGAAGFLNKDFVDIYPRALKKEYQFLKEKYNLQQLQEHQWQFLRIRPISFPTIRLAWLASLIQRLPLLNSILESSANTTILDNVVTSEYWNSHYLFDKLSKQKIKILGDNFKSVLKINVFAPILYAYGKFYKNEQLRDNAFAILYNINHEENCKTNYFKDAIWNKQTAFDTQAFIEMYDSYCSKKRCLECAIGHKILRNNVATVSENNY